MPKTRLSITPDLKRRLGALARGVASTNYDWPAICNVLLSSDAFWATDSRVVGRILLDGDLRREVAKLTPDGETLPQILIPARWLATALHRAPTTKSEVTLELDLDPDSTAPPPRWRKGDAGAAVAAGTVAIVVKDASDAGATATIETRLPLYSEAPIPDLASIWPDEKVEEGVEGGTLPGVSFSPELVARIAKLAPDYRPSDGVTLRFVTNSTFKPIAVHAVTTNYPEHQHVKAGDLLGLVMPILDGWGQHPLVHAVTAPYQITQS